MTSRLFQAHIRHAQYYLHRLRTINDQYHHGGPNIETVLRQFEQELAQIQQGWQWSYEQMGESDNAAELYSLYANDGRHVFALRLPAEGQYRQAIAHYEQSLPLIAHDEANTGMVLANIAAAYRNLGQCEQALEYSQRALAIARQAGDRHIEGNRLANIGNIHYGLGQHREALDFYERALAISRETGDISGECARLGNIGNVYYGLGQYQTAID